MADFISKASMGDPIELGVRAAQLRCLTNIPKFRTDDEHLLYAMNTIRESEIPLAKLSPHSVAFFAEVASVAIFARQHFNDEPLSVHALRALWEHLIHSWNSFTHYG